MANLNARAPTIREERAKIGLVELIKLAFLVSRSKTLPTNKRLFEEKCCLYILRLKQTKLNKCKDCYFALENIAKLAFFCMESV